MKQKPKMVKVAEDFFTEIPYKEYEAVLYVLLQTPRDGDPRDPNCRMGAPAITWGLSGTAKSARLDALVTQVLRFPLEKMFPVSYPAENFVGVPVIYGNKMRSEVLIGPIRRLLDSKIKDAVLLIDEVSDADSLTQAAMQPLILDRQAGDDQLPPGVRILLLGNPPRYSAGGYEIVAALANRLGHFYLPVNMDTMQAFRAHLANPAPPKLIPFSHGAEEVKDNWKSEWALYTGEVDTFLEAMGEVKLLHNQPEAGTTEAGGAWPSLRTWYIAMQCATTLRCLKMNRALEPLFFQAFIGKAVADKFGKWQVYKDLPSPRDIIDRKKGWDITSEERVDRISVMCAALRTYVMGGDTRQEQEDMAAVAWEWFGLLCDANFKDIVKKYGNEFGRQRLSNKSTSKKLKDAARSTLIKLSEGGLLKV